MGKSEHQMRPKKGAEKDHDRVCTPPEVLDPIVEHFGYIAMDPYSDPRSVVRAQLYVELPRYHADPPRSGCDPKRPGLIVGDGDVIPWARGGVVFVNPRYSDLGPPLRKVALEAARGVEIITLLPVRTSHSDVQDVVSTAAMTVFWRGRITFLGEKYGAPFHSMLSYWGPRVNIFDACWSRRMWRIRGPGGRRT